MFCTWQTTVSLLSMLGSRLKRSLPVLRLALESLADLGSLLSFSLSSLFLCSLFSRAVGVYPTPKSGDNGGDTTDSEPEMSDLTDFSDEPPQLSPKSFSAFFPSVPVSNRESFGFCLTLFKLFGDLWRGDVTGGEMVRASSLSTSSSSSLSCFCGPDVPRRSLMSSSGSEWALLIIFWYAAVSVSGTSSSKSSSYETVGSGVALRFSSLDLLQNNNKKKNVRVNNRVVDFGAISV